MSFLKGEFNAVQVIKLSMMLAFCIYGLWFSFKIINLLNEIVKLLQ